ncbi:MAG: hypothetical protein J1F38_09670 [Muribaculaceae bacterium]|nr:hypothetical protein [Muribaculaceae bacterium]
MKNYIKNISLAVACLAGMSGMTSCDDTKNNDFVDYYDGKPGVYFSTTENSYLELVEGQNTISMPVYRDEAGDALTVPITVTPLYQEEETDIYTFPSSVTFAAGSKVADLVIGYDITKAEMGVEQEFEVTLDSEATPFSTNTVVITLVSPAPWEYLGEGEYYDWFWGVSESGNGTRVKFWQQGINKNIYRISNPYVALNDEDSYFQFVVLQPGDVFLGESITQQDLVGWSEIYLEYSAADGDDVYFFFPGYFQNWTHESSWVYNRVVDYQDDGKPGYIQLAGVYFLPNLGAGASYVNNPTIEIIFPDFEVLDYSLEMSYLGILKDSSQKESALLNVELGADITDARAAVAPGTNADALVASILSGTAKYIEFSESGNVTVPFNYTETGNYVVAVVGYIGNEAKSYDTASFLYVSSGANYDPNEGWETLGYVQYTDGFICTRTFLEPPYAYPCTYYVELQESIDTPDLYRLVNPYGPGSIWDPTSEYDPYTATYIEIDATNPQKVVLTPSDQQFVMSYEDGTIDVLEQVWCVAGYYEENNRPDLATNAYGSFTNGKFTFPATALMAYWDSTDPDPEYTGYFTANFVLDWDNYVASGGEDPLLYNDYGEIVAPFMVDLNTLTAIKPASAAKTSVRTMSLKKTPTTTTQNKFRPQRRAANIEKAEQFKDGKFENLTPQTTLKVRRR